MIPDSLDNEAIALLGGDSSLQCTPAGGQRSVRKTGPAAPESPALALNSAHRFLPLPGED